MRVAKVALAALAVLLAAACVVVLVQPTAVPGKSAAEKADDRNLAVTLAATKVIKAVLDLDYRDMDKRTDTVLGLATGTFKNQYETASTDLKTRVEQGKVVARSTVHSLGLADVDDDTAVVYVAVDTDLDSAKIQKKKAAGQEVADKSYYRFQLTLSKVGGRWLLNDLQGIS